MRNSFIGLIAGVLLAILIAPPASAQLNIIDLSGEYNVTGAFSTNPCLPNETVKFVTVMFLPDEDITYNISFQLTNVIPSTVTGRLVAYSTLRSNFTSQPLSNSTAVNGRQTFTVFLGLCIPTTEVDNIQSVQVAFTATPNNECYAGGELAGQCSTEQEWANGAHLFNMKQMLAQGQSCDDVAENVPEEIFNILQDSGRCVPPPPPPPPAPPVSEPEPICIDVC